MKFSSIFATAFAAFATAVPTHAIQERAVNASQPGFEFNQVDLKYLLNVNNLDLKKLESLGRKNKLDVIVFQELFEAQVFSLEALLQFQQLSTLLAIASTGIFDGFDLAKLNLGGVELGLIEGIGAVDLSQFIDVTVISQITIIAEEVTTVVINAKE